MRRIACGLLCLLLSAVTPAHATLRTWPGAAPCDSTLNACLNAASADDTVQVQSNGPIDEAVSISKPLTLVAAPGYRPALAAGRGIAAYYGPGAGIAWSMTIDGFTLIEGGVGVRPFSGDATITLRNLDIYATTTSYVGGIIGIDNFGTGHLVYTIERNRVRMNGSSGLQGIALTSGNGGTFEGTIHDNRIESVSTVGDGGIQIIGTSASAPSVSIYSNRISGNMYAGMIFWAAGGSKLTLVDNAMGSALATNGYGLNVVGGDASVFNNTFAGFGTGISLNSGITGRLSNNIIAYSSTQAINIQGMPAATEDHTLYFSNGGSTTLGTGSFVADPRFRRGIADMRLTAGSPAIDAADSAALSTLLANASVPEIDADGSRRFKGAGSVADIGAFEYGDAALIESVTALNAGVIDSPVLNGNSSALPQIVQDESPDTYVAPAFDAGFSALAYVSNKFSVVDEADGGAPTTQSAYNVFVPAAGNGVFEHVSSLANVTGVTTGIDDPYTVGHGERILLATHIGPPLFNHPFGLMYSGFWFIEELDGGIGFPQGLGFAIYAQDPSLNAFVWSAPEAGVTTAIDHILLNDEPCGRVYVTNGNLNPHPIEVKYALQRWTIVNVDGATMPLGAQFNVVVDEAAIDFCRYDHIFHDGVEAL